MHRTARTGLALASTLFVLLAVAVPARAQVDRFVGRTIGDVRLTILGRAVSDVELGNALETRKGEALSMALVRESIIHLMALSRFENVRVNAQLAGDQVVLVYDLVPLRTVRGIDFAGRLVLPESLLRTEVVQRYGSSPPPGRRDDIAQALEDLYREHGFPKPTVKARLSNQMRPGRATLTFDIDAGSQARVRQVRVESDGGIDRTDLLRRLRLREGSAYDPTQVSQRVSTYVNSLRARGFYTARVDLAPRPSDDGSTVDVAITAERGPKVVVQVEGAAIPGQERDRLIPAASERSIDQDLLEDWSNNIERYFQAQGYARVSAPFERRESRGAQQLTIVFKVALGPRYVIDAIDIAGNQHFDRAQLLGLVGARPGQSYVQRTVDVGVRSLIARYQRDGYATASVKSSATTRSTGRTEVRQLLTLDVAEGPRTLIRSVTFACNGNGACVLPDATLRAALTASGPSGLSVVPDAPFYLPDLDRARDALQVQYVTRGYLLAAIELPPPDKMVSPDRTKADVRFVIHEGPQIRVDHVLIVGNNRTKAGTIRSQLQIHPGDPLDLEKLAESQRRLTDLGLFRRVRVTQLQQASEEKRDVLVIVEEAPTTTMAYGGGVEGAKRLRERDGAAVPAIELAPRVLFDIGRRNLWGKNRSINFNSSAAVRPNATTTNLVGTGLWEYRAIGTYREPRIFTSATDLTVTGGVEQAVRTSYTYNRRAVRGQVAHQLTPRLGLYGRYALERTHILSEQASVEQQVLIDRLFSQFLLSKVSASLVADTRDDAIDPSRGTLTSFELDLAPRLIGSEVGFVKTLFQTFVYRQLPASRRIVFAGGARLGLARGFLGPIPGTDTVARTVPISERFFSGNTVRGFVEDRLGTPDTVTPEGFPSGGNALLILNSELRVSITKDLAVVGFTDAGNVFGRVSELSVRDIRPGLGFGVRYKSPLGPIRLDLGFNPARRIYGGTLEPLTSIYFGVGQAF